MQSAVAVADSQSTGLGRLGRRWYSPRGGLYMSVVFSPQCDAALMPLLALATSLGLASALRNLYGLDANLRWPNDVMIQRRKVGGILVEVEVTRNRITRVIIGIGLNLNNLSEKLPRGIAVGAISVREALGRSVRRKGILEALLRRLDDLYSQVLQGRGSDVLDLAKSMMGSLGRRVSVQVDQRIIEGTAVDIGKNGELVIRKSDGSLVTVTYGEVVRSVENTFLETDGN